jgi:predicted AAA+ superfamily ATPase
LQLIDEIKQKFKVKSNEIIYLNKEDLQRDAINTYKELYTAVKDYKYIFIDEIQDIEHWEKAIRSLHATGEYDIYITGSNSNVLSSELSTFLSGRYVSFHIYPLNYQEFLQFHTLEHSNEAFLKYLKFGGLPYLKNLQLEEEIVYSYLKDVVNTILLKDVIARNKIRNIDFYKKLIEYLASETGSIFSAKSLSNYLKNQNVRLSANVVLNYLDNSISASFLNKVSRYDLKGKKLFEIFQKYYFTDIGIKNALVGGYSKLHLTGLLENVVYCDLVAKGWEVCIGELDKKEVDFIAKKDEKIMYLQVAYLLESEATQLREFSPLLAIRDSREKYVITMDEGACGTRDGVQWINIMDFLLK